jgi:Spermidine/putrescine-binding periplasmic protein
VFKGEQILLPFDWGTEGVTYNQAQMPINGQVSYGDLWADAAKGKAAFRQKSVIMGTGLYLDAIGEVPSNRMLDVYKSEDDARRVWGAITQWMLERKDNFGAFWNNATEASSAFTEAGAIIGQTWDTTGLLLNRDNADFVYRAPKEGIITWLDSFGILKQAENPEQAVAFMNFMLKPETGGMFANNTGYNSAVVGAADFASEEFKTQFNEVYTSDVLGNMWWWQADTPFFGPVRDEFVEIITNA